LGIAATECSTHSLLSEHKNLGDFGFLVGDDKMEPRSCFPSVGRFSPVCFGGRGGGGVRVLNLCNTRSFQVFETKFRATIEPLGSGYLKKLWNQRIIGFHERTGQKIVGFHERTDKGPAGNRKQVVVVVVFFFQAFSEFFFLENCSFIIYNTIGYLSF
jgi:hypothetical protein